MLPELSQEEIQRYSRHLLIPEVGLEGQRKLKSASVLLVGTGGLGSPVALYLAAAGVGHIGIVDYDVVEASNLQRQIIHGTERVGRLKVESARQRMLELNPLIQVDAFNEVFTSQNAERIAAGYDILVDGTDNFPTRYLINDLCVLTGRPYVYGSVFRFEGQVSVFRFPRRPLLSLPLPGAATARKCAFLRGWGSLWCDAGDCWYHPGGGNDQIDPGDEKVAGRPLAADRRAGDALPGNTLEEST